MLGIIQLLNVHSRLVNVLLLKDPNPLQTEDQDQKIKIYKDELTPLESQPFKLKSSSKSNNQTNFDFGKNSCCCTLLIQMAGIMQVLNDHSKLVNVVLLKDPNPFQNKRSRSKNQNLQRRTHTVGKPTIQIKKL